MSFTVRGMCVESDTETNTYVTINVQTTRSTLNGAILA